jgi:hypothetical protein
VARSWKSRAAHCAGLPIATTQHVVKPSAEGPVPPTATVSADGARPARSARRRGITDRGHHNEQPLLLARIVAVRPLGYFQAVRRGAAMTTLEAGAGSPNPRKTGFGPIQADSHSAWEARIVDFGAPPSFDTL